MGPAAQEHRGEASEEAISTARYGELIACGGMELLDGSRGIATAQRPECLKGRQVSESNVGVLRELFVEILRQRLGARDITRERQRKRSAVLHIPALGGQVERRRGVPLCLLRIPEEGFPHCRSSVVRRGIFALVGRLQR